MVSIIIVAEVEFLQNSGSQVCDTEVASNMTKTLALFVTVPHRIVFYSPRHSKLEVVIAKFPLVT